MSKMRRKNELRPKTGAQGEMRIRKPGDVYGDVIVPFCCPNCGFVEWYIEKKLINQK